MPVTSAEAGRFPWRQYLHPRYWHVWLGMGLVRLLSWLPLPAIAVLGAALGQLIYFLYPPRRHVALRNIGRCFPELGARRARALTRKNFRATGQALLATGVAWWGSRARLRRLVRCANGHIIEEAVAAGRPVILLVGHFVALEMGGMYLASRWPIIDIYRRPRNPLLHAFMVQCRSRFGMGTLAEFKEGIKPVIRALRRKELLYYLPDQDFGRRRSVFAPFFGIQTATLPALGRLVSLTGAAVIPCFSKQLPAGRGYELIVHPPLEGFDGKDEQGEAARMNRIIEQAVRDMPEQYFWLHKRFKTRPEGEPDFYK